MTDTTPPLLTIPASLACADRATAGTLSIQILTRRDLLRKRIIRTVLLFLATIVSALIPIVHLILAPLMLVATLISAFAPAGARALILSGQGSCPGCDAPFRIMKRGYRESFQDVCESCSRGVAISSKLAEQK